MKTQNNRKEIIQLAREDLIIESTSGLVATWLETTVLGGLLIQQVVCPETNPVSLFLTASVGVGLIQRGAIHFNVAHEAREAIRELTERK